MIYVGDNIDQFNATPVVTEFERGIVTLELHGRLTFQALRELRLAADSLASAPEVKGVVLVVNSHSGSMSAAGALAALGRLSREKALLAYVRNAGGLALVLAMLAVPVIAHPLARIGPLGARPLATVAAAFCPLSPERWARLIDSSITGEQAEARGLVHWLAMDEAEILSQMGAL